MAIQNADLSRPDAKPASPVARVLPALPASAGKQPAMAPQAKPARAWPFMVRSGSGGKAE